MNASRCSGSCLHARPRSNPASPRCATARGLPCLACVRPRWTTPTPHPRQEPASSANRIGPHKPSCSNGPSLLRPASSRAAARLYHSRSSQPSFPGPDQAQEFRRRSECENSFDYIPFVYFTDRLLHGFILLPSGISSKMTIFLDTITIIAILVVLFLSLSHYLPLVWQAS